MRLLYYYNNNFKMQSNWIHDFTKRGLYILLLFFFLIEHSFTTKVEIENGSEPLPVAAERRFVQRIPHRPNHEPMNLRRPPRHPSLPWAKNPRHRPHGPRIPGPVGKDLEAHAQTLYDLRGFHIPLGHDETQRYLRSQNSPTPQALVFPSFFQPQSNVHENRPQIQVTPLSIFGHNQHHQEKSGNSFESSSGDFRPSQPDVGDKSTTENVFKPFVPKQFITTSNQNQKDVKEQEQNDEQIPNQVEQQNPFIYVYDYDDGEEQNSNNKNKNQLKDAKSTSITLLPAKSIEHPQSNTQQFVDNQYYTDNFIPFHEPESNQNQQNYYTNSKHQPNVEIVPSSERRPPPDQRNSIRDTQILKSSNYEEQQQNYPQQIIEIEPTQFEPKQSNFRNNKIHSTAAVPTAIVEHEHNPYPTVSPELYANINNHNRFLTQQQHVQSNPTNPFANNINPTSYFQPPPKIQQHQQQQNFRPHQQQQFTNEPNEIQQDPFELSFVQKYQTPYTQTHENQLPKARPVNTIFVPHQQQPQQHHNQQSHQNQEQYEFEEEFEEIAPVTTTQPTTTTTTTTTTQPPPTTSRNSLFRNRFPPFRGGNGNGLLGSRSTTTTEEPTTIQPRRINRPRLRTTAAATTTTTTTTTTPEPVYYDEEQLNDNSVEEREPERTIPRTRQRKNGIIRQSKQTLQTQNEELQQPRRAGGRIRGNSQQQQQEEYIIQDPPQTEVETAAPRNGKIRNREWQQQTQQQQNNFVVENPPPNNNNNNNGLLNFQNQRGVIHHHSGFGRPQGGNPTISTVFQAPGYLPNQHPSHEIYEQPITFPRRGNIFQNHREFENIGPFGHPPHPGLIPQRNFNPYQPHRLQISPKPHGKPLYVHSGKIKQGGLYANLPVLPEYHNYGTPILIEEQKFLEPIVNPTRAGPGSNNRIRKPGRQRARDDIRLITPVVNTVIPQQIREEPQPIRTAVFTESREVSTASPSRILRPRQRERQTSTPAPIVEITPEPPRRKQLKRIRVTPDSIIRVTTPEPSSSTTGAEQIVVFYNRDLINTQPSAPSLQFTLPSTAKPNPLRRKPKLRPFQQSQTVTVTPTPSTSSSTEIYTETPAPAPKSSRPRKLVRAGSRIKKPKLLNNPTEAPTHEPISLSSAKVFRKPTEAPNRFSSKYRDETLTLPPPTQPVSYASVPESEYVTQANFAAKPKKLKFIPTSTSTPKRKQQQEEEKSELPSTVFLKPQDVIANRQPACRIPPGSASERLKVLQQRRKNVLNKAQKKFIISTTTTTQAPEEEVGDEEEEYEYASSSEQIKREIQHSSFHPQNALAISKFNLVKGKYKPNSNNHSQEQHVDSEETGAIVGVPKPTPTEESINTAESLAWIPLNTSRIVASSSRNTSTQSTTTTTSTTESIQTIKSEPAQIESLSSFSPSSSPFNLFSMSKSDSSPTLPLEAIFPILSKESKQNNNSTSTSA